MTTKPNEPDALEPMPCPFCAASFRHVSDKDGEFWMHPGVVTDDDCFMSGQGIFPRQLSAWNRRAPAQPIADAGGVIEVNRIATLLMDTWKRVDPNSGVAKNMCSYVATFADMARAVIADRLQSVAAATAAKDAEIARLKGQFDRYFHEAANAQEEVERLREGIERALCCTPSIQSERSQFHGIGDTHKIVYDCGNPWKILRAALSEAREAGDTC